MRLLGLIVRVLASRRSTTDVSLNPSGGGAAGPSRKSTVGVDQLNGVKGTRGFASAWDGGVMGAAGALAPPAEGCGGGELTEFEPNDPPTCALDVPAWLMAGGDVPGAAVDQL